MVDLLFFGAGLRFCYQRMNELESHIMNTTILHSAFTSSYRPAACN